MVNEILTRASVSVTTEAKKSKLVVDEKLGPEVVRGLSRCIS